MAASMSTLEANLKEAYLGTIQTQLNNEIELFQHFSKAEAMMDATGKYGIIPVKLGRNTGVGARLAGQTLPSPGNQVIDKLTVSYKFVYGAFGFDGPSIAASKKNIGAFATVAELEMDGLGDDVKKYANLCGFLGGQFIGLVIEKANQVALDYSGRWEDITVGGGETVSYFRLDTFAQVGADQALTALTASEITVVVAINTAGVTPGVPIAVRLNCLNAANLKIVAEPTGILGNMVQVTHHGLARSAAANATLISNYRTMNAGDVYAALDLDDMGRSMDAAEIRSGDTIDRIWMHKVQRQSYESVLQGTNAGNLFVNVKEKGGVADGGFSGGLTYRGVKLDTSNDCPKGTIFFLSNKSWKRVELQEGGFAEDDGSILKWVANQDAYVGYWRSYYELVSLKPNASALLTGVSFT